jgi:hypothetical protein
MGEGLDEILKDRFEIIGELDGVMKRCLCGCYGVWR